MERSLGDQLFAHVHLAPRGAPPLPCRVALGARPCAFTGICSSPADVSYARRFAYHQCVCLDPSAYIDFGASHWADRQHGRSFGSARCPHGISRRDGRRAEYAFESGNFRDPRDRALRLSIQETNLCDRENFSSGCQVSIEIL